MNATDARAGRFRAAWTKAPYGNTVAFTEVSDETATATSAFRTQAGATAVRRGATAPVAEQAYAEPLALGGALFQFLEVAQYWGSWRHCGRDQVQRLRNRHHIELGPRQRGVSRA